MTALLARQANPVDGAAAGGPGAGSPRRPRRRAWWRRLSSGDWAIDITCLSVVAMGFNRWRVADYPLSDFVFMLAAGIIAVRLLTGRTRTLAPADARRSSPLIFIGALTMLTAGTLSSFGAWNAAGSIGVVFRLAWLTLIWFWILRTIATDRAVFDRLLGAWRIALLFNAVIAAVTELGLANFTVDNAENRQTAFFSHPNDFAGFLVVGVPLILLGVPRSEGRRRGRDVVRRLAEIGLLVFALATTGSMSAALGGAAGLLAALAAMAVTRGRQRRRRRQQPLVVMLGVAVVGIGVVMLSVSDLPIVSRITQLSEGGSGVNASVASREERNTYVLTRADEYLLVGIGLDAQNTHKLEAAGAAAEGLPGSGVHNMHLKILLEAGLPALIGLWIILGVTLRQLWRLMLHTRNDPLHTTAVALFGSVVAVNVFALFQPTLFHRYYWFTIAMTGALWSLRREEMRRDVDEPVAE
jgi:O-antigen ligase